MERPATKNIGIGKRDPQGRPVMQPVTLHVIKLGPIPGKLLAILGAVLPIHFVDSGWRCMYLGVLSAAFGSRHTGFHSRANPHPYGRGPSRACVCHHENKGNVEYWPMTRTQATTRRASMSEAWQV